MANFGPIDTSVLYGQANHRSEDVLGDPDTTLTNMGFLGILQCGHIEIDTHLITALVERWRPETHTFHFSVGEATITLQDISIIWALPIEDAFKRSRIKLSALLDWLLNNTCDDESPFDAVLQEARVCVMCIIGGILCPDATGNTVSLLYLRHMEIIDEERPSNWGTAVLAQQTLLVIVPLTLVIGNMWMEQLVLDCDNSGDDIQSLRETRARNRAIGLDIMTFSSARYPSVRRGPASDDAGPSNVYNEAGPSNGGSINVYNEAGPSNVYNEAGPSNFFTPTGPSYAYTSNMPFSSGDFAHNIHPETRRHLGISPVPFDGSDVNTPIEEPQDIHPRRNRRRPRCGTGGHY
ncbi:UNVERIFIED_CONTAM: protein MAIN-LIKE 2 [Sesamum calycinum]|uniref:Protein MAIN-LIKE 2 n=1 Tax=Sesamum calycinum TaxID=2727403 RepID=A0AAW2KNQ7_9LAMI